MKSRVNVLRGVRRSVLSMALLALGACGSGDAEPTSSIDLEAGAGRDGLIGWNVMSAAYTQQNANDQLSFEWDYFMVHDEGGRFTGSVGYLIANPRNAGAGGLGDMVPKGGNAAVAGRFADGTMAASYKNFGLEGFSASGETRSFDAEDPATGQYALMKPVKADSSGPDRLLLEGKNEAFAWNLEVRQSWKALSGGEHTFAPMHGDDVGKLFPGEEWNVHMLWPRTVVRGWVQRIDTGERIDVAGHGYRENSWGRWAFNVGGWDFAVVSDETSRVSWAWQTYHHQSVALDYLDLGFVDDGQFKLLQFRADAGQLGWQHGSWTFDAAARQCVPLDTHVVARNDQYVVEADVDLAGRQVPMLSDATAATREYVIMIQFPLVHGTIRRADGSVVTTFAGQGGGEFSTARTSKTLTDAECSEWGKTYASALP